MDAVDDPDDPNWPKHCKEAGIRPVFNPYWKDLLYADPFFSVAPDILHQIYQGLIKHLVGWLTEAYGEVAIDARCCRMPPNHYTCIFKNGFCTLSQLTGREHADICYIILGTIADLPLKNNGSAEQAASIVRAVRALLDFAYLAQYPVQTMQTLDEMDDALICFHANKQVFINLGICTDFIINELHYLLHYRLMIERWSTADNYNTEHTERLHISFAKDAFFASNGKNEYSQMSVYVECKEKILDHDKYITWCLEGKPPLISVLSTEIPLSPKMTKYPKKPSVFVHKITLSCEASMFSHALAHYIIKCRNPGLSYAQIETQVSDFRVSLAIYHKARFWLGSKETYKLQSDEYDIVHAQPAFKSKSTKQQDIASQFDTVLVKQDPTIFGTIHNYQVAQVKIIFSFTQSALSGFSPDTQPPKYLAYVEWFQKFPAKPEPNHLLYQIKKSFYQGKCVASIIPLTNISCSVHLFPKFDTITSRLWTNDTVLNKCETFYVNSFTDRHAFNTIL